MKAWETALESFCVTAAQHGIDFYLIGSVTASIRGAEITPHDIDAVVDVKHFWLAEKAFASHIVEAFSVQPEGAVVGLFGGIALDGVRIDVSARPRNEYGRHPIETLCWNGHMLKAQSLDLLYRVYRKNGRVEYMRAIEHVLDSFE